MGLFLYLRIRRTPPVTATREIGITMVSVKPRLKI